MRSALVLVLAGGCSFHLHAAGDGGTDATGTASLIDDTAADFGASDTLEGAVIDPGGTIEPAAFVLGGLHARGYAGNLVSAATTWADIDAAATTPLGESYEQLPQDWGGGHPRALSLNTDDNFTVIYDGELAIPAGDHMVSIDVDDNAALQLGSQVVFAHLETKAISIHEDAPAWLPLRAAIGEDGGTARLVIRVDGTAIIPDQVRAPVNQAQGLLTWIYYAGTGAYAAVGPVVVAPNVDWGMAAPPYDLTGVTNAYTARMMGQLRIAQDGMHTLATTTGSVDDSTEIYIDHHLVSRTSPYPDPHPTTATLPLTAGWHSFVVELSGTQKNALGQMDAHNVTLATTLDGAPITAAMLRPAADTGYLAQALGALTPLNDTTINGGVTTVGIPAATPAPPTGATIDSTSVGYILRHAQNTDYTTVSLDMAGTPLSMPATSALVYTTGDESAAGMPVPQAANAWSFTFTDTVPGDATGFADPGVYVFAGWTFHGGPQRPFAQQLMYVSSVRSLPGITAFGSLRVTGDFGGATATIAVRTAGTAQDLATAGWVDVENGTIPTAAALPYLQYRIVIAGDGWQYPVVDKVELDYMR